MIKQLSTQTVAQGRIFRFDQDVVEHEDGKQQTFDLIRKNDAVGVLASDRDGRFFFVKQYRPASQGAIIEIVAGMVEDGEEPAVAAKRELEEETGCTADSFQYLGALYSSPGFTTERIHIFLASQVYPLDYAVAGDPDERITVLRLSFQEVTDLVTLGHINDMKTVAAFFLLLEKSIREIEDEEDIAAAELAKQEGGETIP
jgi:ADP-ribose pyrophosphatase